jgi:uncharacterized protein (TIGR02271 family)
VASDDKQSVVIPVAREEISVSREVVEKGMVNVRKVVRERVEVIDEPMLHDEVDIERVTMNHAVDAPQPPRQEGDVLIIPVYEEVVTVQRKWVLKEEVRLRRREVQTRHREEVVLREEQALIERRAPTGRRST